MSTKLSKSFSHLRKCLKKLVIPEEDKNDILREFDTTRTYIKNLLRESNLKKEFNKELLSPVDKRYVEYQNISADKDRLTINGETGRLTLKLREGISPQVSLDLTNFVQTLKVEPLLPTKTVRGRITWVKDHYHYTGYNCNRVHTFTAQFWPETGKTLSWFVAGKQRIQKDGR